MTDDVGTKKLEQLGLQQSTFYVWKKSLFMPNYEAVDDENLEDRDPLNPNGAARAYRQYRNLFGAK